MVFFHPGLICPQFPVRPVPSKEVTAGAAVCIGNTDNGDGSPFGAFLMVAGYLQGITFHLIFSI